VTNRLRRGVAAAYRRMRGEAPPEARRRIEGTSLDGFDAELAATAIARLRRFSVYRDEDYLALNPDVMRSDLDPASHAICYGAFEWRRLFTLGRVGEMLAAVGPPPADETGSAARRLGSVAVFVNSNGNAFMREIAEGLAGDLRDVGAQVRLLDETASRADRHDIAIFVAPHEFFALGEGRQWMRDEVVRAAFMFGTEQVQTPWFARSLPFVFMSRGVIDMSYQAAELLRATGLAAIDYLPSSRLAVPALTEDDRLHPLFLGLPDAAKRRSPEVFADRPIDVVFFGTESPRRNEFFKSNADAFGAFRTCFQVRSAQAGPIKLSGGDASLGRLAAHVSGQAKIALNIHQDETASFEWHRMVRLGMAGGCVVVTEPSTRQRGFEPGVHYLEATADRIPELLAWLLRTQEGRAEAERVVRNAIAVVSDRAAACREAARVCGFLAAHARG
jgi:hypothetical protein